MVLHKQYIVVIPYIYVYRYIGSVTCAAYYFSLSFIQPTGTACNVKCTHGRGAYASTHTQTQAPLKHHGQSVYDPRSRVRRLHLFMYLVTHDYGADVQRHSPPWACTLQPRRCSRCSLNSTDCLFHRIHPGNSLRSTCVRGRGIWGVG